MTITSDQIRGVVSNDIPDDADLSNFISTAELIVEEDLSDKGLSESRLALITIYLAAHYGVIKYKFKTDVNVGVSATFQSAIKAGGFSSTHYGQQAMALDSSGTLTYMDKVSQGQSSGTVIVEVL